MHPSHFLRYLPVLTFLLFVAVTSCKKEPLEIGLDLVPPGDTLNIRQTDTCTVISYSTLLDSIRTDELSLMYLGSAMDPVFGKTTASLNTQFRLSSTGFSFGTNPEWDSLVVMFTYKSYQGDTNTPLTVRVYELTEDLHLDSAYFSNDIIQHNGIELASKTFIPHPTDSVTVWGDKAMPHLRINLSSLSPVLADKIIHATDDDLSTNDKFLTFFKGLYITVDPVNASGSILYFEPTGSFSKLSMYFSNEENGDSLRYDFPITSECAYFNHFDHNGYFNASPKFQMQVLYGDTSAGTERVYVQSMGGVRTKIILPYIKDLYKEGKVALNEAMLIFTNAEEEDSLLPARLSFVRMDKEGKVGFLTDQLDDEYYFGGYYNKSTNEYQFRITRYLQRLLEGYYDESFDLYLLADNPVSRSISARRVILFGSDPQAPDSNKRIRLRVTYTKL